MKRHHVQIGVREKTSYVEYARAMFPKARIVEGKWGNLVTQVRQGQLNALLRDEYVLIKLLNQKPELALYTSLYVLKNHKDYIAIALPSSSYNLQAFINIYLESNRINMDVNTLIQTYPEVFNN